MFKTKDIEGIFRQAFYNQYQTQLLGEAEEPLYQPAQHPSQPHNLYYREDFFSSALHEIAHWCIAGEERRKRVDFGYWYTPEGRNSEQQTQFEQAEVKPQALEWMFSVAAGYPFRLSLDNFSEPFYQSENFAKAVQDCALNWCDGGIPERGFDFIQALETFYNTKPSFNKQHFLQLPR